MVLDRFNPYGEGSAINTLLIHRPGDLSSRPGQSKNKLPKCAGSSYVGKKLQRYICSIKIWEDKDIRSLLELGIWNLDL